MNESDLEEGGVWRILGESCAKRAPEGFVGDVMCKIRVRQQELGVPVWLVRVLPFFSAGAFAAVVLCSGLTDHGVKEGVVNADFLIYEVEDVVLYASQSVWAPKGEIQP